MKTVYLDNAATTKMRPDVIEAVTISMKNLYANASATYGIGRKAKTEIELIRKKIAQALGVLSSEIIYTSGGTEANNMILHTAIRDLGVKRIITSKIEHHAVLSTIQHISSKYNVAVDYVNFTDDGDCCLTDLENKLKESKELTLVSLMHINNEIGTILDLKAVGELCEQNQALFHTDSVQSIGHFNLNLKEDKVHFATASAHKFYGPKGVGFTYIEQNMKAKPSLYGGEQERGLRAGTEAVPLIVGMGKALVLAYANLDNDQTYITNIKNYAVSVFKKQMPTVSFNASCHQTHRNYNLLNVCLPIPSEKAAIVLFQLDLLGICCSRGSACQSGSNKPSHVLAEILPPERLALTSLRFSFSIYTTKDEIDYLVVQLKKIIS